MENETSFDRLIRDLDLAAAAYSDTCKELEAARRENTLALNKLNEAQKAFDKAAADRREKAPRDSHWNRPQQRSVEINI